MSLFGTLLRHNYLTNHRETFYTHLLQRRTCDTFYPEKINWAKADNI